MVEHISAENLEGGEAKVIRQPVELFLQLVHNSLDTGSPLPQEQLDLCLQQAIEEGVSLGDLMEAYSQVADTYFQNRLSPEVAQAIKRSMFSFLGAYDRLLKEELEKGRQASKEMAVLCDLVRFTAHCQSLEQTLKEIISLIGNAVGSAYSTLRLVREDGTIETRVVDFHGAPPFPARPREHGITARAIQRRWSIYVPRPAQDPDFSPQLLATGVVCCVAVPILREERAIGCLFVCSRQEDAFADKMDLLVACAHEAGNAIQRARLMEESRQATILKESERLKTALLSNVAHELRNPLTLIKGNTTAFLRYHRRLSSQEGEEFLYSIDQATDRLTDLIKRLLDLSEMEAGGFSLNRDFISIGQFIQQAAREIRLRAPAHRVEVHLSEGGLPRVWADPRRLRQVLDNLLDNAAKFSPEGTEIAVTALGSGHEIEVIVSDQGQGIPPQDLPHIFDRFYRGEGARARPGVGLGLAICQHIIEAHQGRLWVESHEGKGSAFHFTIPILSTPLPQTEGANGQP